jgi:hypothetical protein
MQQRGNTIDIMGLNIGVVKGSVSDAANLLLLRRWNKSLGVLVLAHVAIITAISLVVGKSITTVTDTGRVELLFDYPMNISILIEDGALGTMKYGPTRAWLTKSAANLRLSAAPLLYKTAAPNMGLTPSHPASRSVVLYLVLTRSTAA